MKYNENYSNLFLKRFVCKNNRKSILICNANQKTTILLKNYQQKNLSKKSIKNPIQKDYNDQNDYYDYNDRNDRIIIYIKSTFNNILLTLTNLQGQVLIRVSAGTCGFKGSRKGTPFAAKKTAEFFIKRSNEYLLNCNQIKICVCGVGPGRENALRGLAKISKINENKKQNKRQQKNKRKNKFIPNKIVLIREVTKIPHNGCRPPKKRRL